MTIVVGYRANEFGEIALEHALTRAQATSSRLVVVNVARGEGLDDPDFIRGHELEQLRMKLGNSGLAGYDVSQPVGAETVELLLEALEKEDVNLLIIGIRPRSAVGKFLMGSVAQKVLMGASVPVLTVKPGQVPAPVM